MEIAQEVLTHGHEVTADNTHRTESIIVALPNPFDNAPVLGALKLAKAKVAALLAVNAVCVEDPVWSLASVYEFRVAVGPRVWMVRLEKKHKGYDRE